MNERRRRTRRQMLRKGAEMAGALALGGLVNPTRLLAATPGPVVLQKTDSTYPQGTAESYYTNKVLGCWEFVTVTPLDSVGWPHALTNLVQDNRGSTQGSEHAHWDTPNRDFRADFCWKFMAGVASGTVGWFVYREQNSQNFYQLELRKTGVALVKRINGAFSDFGFLSQPITVGGEFMFRLEVVGSQHTLRSLT